MCVGVCMRACMFVCLLGDLQSTFESEEVRRIGGMLQMTTYLNAVAAADTVPGVDNRASLCRGVGRVTAGGRCRLRG